MDESVNFPTIQAYSGHIRKIKKVLAFYSDLVYHYDCCGMIAMKREVAAGGRYNITCRFSVERKSCKLTTSHCTKQLSTT